MQTIKFNPTKAELEAVATEARKISIKDIDDKEGYQLMKKARVEIGKYRTKITKFGKLQRQEARDYADEVIRQEKELLGIIVPVEDEMKDKIKEVDDTILYNKRLVMLPSRRDMMKAVNGQFTDEDLMQLDEEQFSQLYTSTKEAFNAEKKRIEEEKEQEAQRVIDEEKRKEEAVENAVAEEKARAEREKENERIAEERRKENEEQKKRDDEAKKTKEEEAMKANEKFQSWLKENNVTEDDEDIIIKRDGETISLYKRISQLTLK